jgi:L-threonylcarbamoyladenylate synthase
VKGKAEIIKIDPARPETAWNRCREVLRAGGVIAYPTDTFYGLGADPRNSRAVKKLFTVKGRPANLPILLLIAGAEDAPAWAAEIPPRAADLMKRCWPGPLTLVFKARDDVPAELTAGKGTIGLRVPGSELTRELLRAVGRALTGTSANRSGCPSLCTAEETNAAIGGMVDLILDGGKTAGGRPSTIVDISGGTPQLIREGAYSCDRLAQDS